MDNKITAIYLRVSTLDKHKGLQSQQHTLQEYTDNHGFPHVQIYADRVTGATLDRPALQRLQQDIFEGKVDTVIVWKLDRLSRSLRDGINVLTDWLEKGIRVISVSQQFDFSGAVGKLISSVLFAVAEMERQNIRENIIRGQQVARAAGKRWGGSRKGRLVNISPQQLKTIRATIQKRWPNKNKSEVDEIL